MRGTIRFVLILFAISLCSLTAFAAEKVITTWGGDAEMVYDTGFMQKLMKHPDGDVSLFNMELIENDSPGSGHSEKGVYTDTIWGKNRARKILYRDDPRAESAWVVIFPYYRSGKYPLKFTVNGRESEIPNWDTDYNREWYRWSEFPAEWLKKGGNVIELYCPEAETDEEGWKKTGERWTWLLQSGRNTLRVRAVNKLGAKGKPSWAVLNHGDAPFGE